METGRGFIPIEPEKEEGQAESMYRHCYVCGKNVYWREAKNLSFCYPEHYDIIMGLLNWVKDRQILRPNKEGRWEISFESIERGESENSTPNT